MRSRTPVVPVARHEGPAPRTYGFLTSYPPTACGIATFSAALGKGLVASGGRVEVVRCGAPFEVDDPAVRAALDGGSPDRRAAALDVLNDTDVVVVQHEYGLYDGADGEDLLPLLDEIVVPLIVVAHTVVQAPSPNQRRVLERVCDAADAVVVMTRSGLQRLVEGYDVDASKVTVIVHGAATALSTQLGSDRSPRRGARLLTWGLLGPGKGIEWAIDALADLDDLRPRPTYVVAGSTHPKVVARSGEAYRQMLIDRARLAGVDAYVSFDGNYRGLAALTELIRSADLVVLPYDSQDQVTSGVLVDAVAAGRPVVSTAFPHAVELLSSGAGLIVPQRDPVALAAAIRSVVTDPARAAAMASEARRLAPDLSWNAVAGRYHRLAGQLVSVRQGVRT